MDINTLEHGPATKLDLNEIAAVDVKTTLPLFFDPYRENRHTGSFILIDPLTNATVAAGIIERAVSQSHAGAAATLLAQATHRRTSGVLRFGHPSAAVWLRAARTWPNFSSEGSSTRAGTCSSPARTIFCRTSLLRWPRRSACPAYITIFSPLDDGTDQKQVVRAIFGPDSFFAVRIDDDTR